MTAAERAARAPPRPPRFRHINAGSQTPHLKGIKRQRGGISSLAEDGSQSKLQKFFAKSPSKKHA